MGGNGDGIAALCVPERPIPDIAARYPLGGGSGYTLRLRDLRPCPPRAEPERTLDT